MDGDNPTTYRGGQLVELAALGTDPDPGDVVSLGWKVVINHAGTHTHDWDAGTGGTFSFTTDVVHDQPSTYEVTIQAEDKRGLAAKPVTLVLQPETSPLALTSTPGGAVVNHGGTDHVTPYTGVSTIGVQVGISAEESLLSNGLTYQFEAWSNGGSRSQTLTMPAAGLSLNANYSAPPGPPLGGGGSFDVPDESSARLLFNPKSGLVTGRKSTLKGTVGDPSGLQTVQVALRQVRKVGGKCRWWSQRKGGFPKGTTSCARPVYMSAQLKGSGEQVSWTLPLHGHLPKGSYLLFFRTEDRAGNVGAGPNGARSIVLRVK